MSRRSSVWIIVFALMVGLVSPALATRQEPVLATRGPRFLAVPRGGGAPVDASNDAVLRRRVSLALVDVGIERALQTIARQVGLELMYSAVTLPKGKSVTLQAADITMAAALTEVLLNTGIDIVFLHGGQMGLVKRGSHLLPARMIVGRVIDGQTKLGLALAEVLLGGTAWRATTDSIGNYRLAGVSPGRYTIAVRRLGYVKQSRAVVVEAAQDDTVNFALEPAAIPLNDLVTTATGPQRRRELGNAITTIRADSVLQTAPIRSLTDLLENRVPGMSVQHTSGAPGDPARIRLRGLGSVMRSNDPVVVVDGVRIYAVQAEARSGNLTNAFSRPNQEDGRPLAPAPSPLDQIDPNIIEKVEVFKGPSAATLYGADAANGVIVITTKRGRAGPTQWTANVTHGRTESVGRYPTAYFRFGHSVFNDAPQFCTILDQSCILDSLVRYQALNDPDATVLGNGRRTSASLTASGGSKALTYSVTGTYSDESGLLRLPQLEVDRFRASFNREAPDWMRRPHNLTTWSVASNITALLGTTADVTLATSLSRSEQQRSSLESQLGALATLYVDKRNSRYMAPSGSTYLVDPASSLLRSYYNRITASAITFTTGLNARWRPWAWLNASGQAGVNVIPRDDDSFIPGGLTSATDSGRLSRGTGQSIVGTFNAQGTARKPLGRGFVFETSVGANLTTTNTADLITAAWGLVPGTESISGADSIVAVDAHANTSVFGWYIEPRIASERFSLSTGLRLDGGSAYGARVSGLGGAGLLGLPKLNGSWVISEESFFPFTSLFSSFRLRGAYGQAQVQPGAADRLRLYADRLAIGSDLTSDPDIITSLGNTKLRPERGTEIEGGFDADLFDNRLSLEFTGYRKTKIDALMSVTLPGSVNGGGQVLRNVGNIRNSGVEVTARLTPIQSSQLTWTTELNYTRNTNVLTKLGEGVDPNPQEGLVAGYPLAGRWELPIIGFADQKADGVIQPRELVIGDSVQFMGQLMPRHETSLFTNLAVLDGAVGISAGFSYEAGATQLDRGPTSHWVMARALADPSAPLVDQAAVVAYNNGMDTRTSGGSNTTLYGLLDEVATFRFKSLAVRYRAPNRVARLLWARQLSIAVQGDNLALRTNYRGKDPDISGWSPGEQVIDTGQLPMPRTWQLRVDLRY